MHNRLCPLLSSFDASTLACPILRRNGIFAACPPQIVLHDWLLPVLLRLWNLDSTHPTCSLQGTPQILDACGLLKQLRLGLLPSRHPTSWLIYMLIVIILKIALHHLRPVLFVLAHPGTHTKTLWICVLFRVVFHTFILYFLDNFSWNAIVQCLLTSPSPQHLLVSHWSICKINFHPCHKNFTNSTLSLVHSCHFLGLSCLHTSFPYDLCANLLTPSHIVFCPGCVDAFPFIPSPERHLEHSSTLLQYSIALRYLFRLPNLLVYFCACFTCKSLGQ